MHMPSAAAVRPLVIRRLFPSDEAPDWSRPTALPYDGAVMGLSRVTDAHGDVFVNALILFAKTCRCAATIA
jgi:hypothetical protein